MRLFGFGTPEPKELSEKKKAHWDAWSARIKLWMFVLAFVVEIALLVFVAQQYGVFGSPIPRGDKIAVVDFNQPVTQKYVNTVIQQMDRIKEDPDYRSVLFIMNSPGGSPTAAEELSGYLRAYSSEKNVTMYVQSIAASGGYYIASAIRPIIANQNAIVGSIGVIMPHYSIGELAKKVGIEEDDLSAGKYKKPLSLFRKLSDQERAYLQAQLLTPTYQNFIRAVATNRGLTQEKLQPYTEGKIFVANDPAIQGILVDEISILHTVKSRLKRTAPHPIHFVNILPEEKLGFLKDKIELKLSLDSKYDEGLR